MIDGCTRPMAGRVLIGAQDVTRWAPFARPVNTVFQDRALFPHRSVRVAKKLRGHVMPTI
ncbi:hypothetical protein [Caldimonas sp. KR1-144]|uniref:hypothetical protein n=1 Tax=Caldimonas sp. KR1-144 TaxID=3400911 RepID=UPI003C0BEA04